jgi:hypothetical protein
MGQPCKIGCTCFKHAPRTKANLLKRSQLTAEAWKRGVYANRPLPKGRGKYNFSGGKQGRKYWTLLYPANYVRELLIHLGKERFRLDFALVDRKVDIEIDGRWHVEYSEGDAERDRKLKAAGWKVIRVKDIPGL